MENCRKAHHSEEFKKELVKRLDKIEGQIKGIKKMIEGNKYCDDILNQITGIRSALAGVQQNLLSGHIKTCIFDQIKEGKIEVVEELTTTIRRMLK